MKKIIIAAICLLQVIPFFAAYNHFGIPDSSEIRRDLVENWFEAPLESVRQNRPEVYYNSSGDIFQVRLEEADSFFSIFVAPKAVMSVDVYSDEGKTTEEHVVYPGDVPGSWVLIRDKKTGKPLRIRYYFLQNSEVFIQFSPYGKIALADLVIFGCYAAKGVSTGIPFEKFYSASIEEAYSITKTKLPWRYVQIELERFQGTKQMAAVIREQLPNIIYTENAMYDENGDLVHLLTGKKFDSSLLEDDKIYLSSQGFLKWVADGLVEPITGGQLKREPLLEETVHVKETGRQGILSQDYNLYFSLNWIRNLASAVVSVNTGTKYLFNQSGVDVTIEPFAAEITSNKTSNSVTFIQDSGYLTANIKTLFYILAATEPETIYFAAVRRIDRSVVPEVKAFNECVLFMPYFETNGSFSCFVFMNGRELTLDEFCRRYSDDFVYLTKVKASERFYPYSK